MSKIFIAGEPVADFFEMDSKHIGCWICKTSKNADSLQRSLTSAAPRKKVKINVGRMPAINGDHVRYVVFAKIVTKEIKI